MNNTSTTHPAIFHRKGISKRLQAENTTTTITAIHAEQHPASHKSTTVSREPASFAGRQVADIPAIPDKNMHTNRNDRWILSGISFTGLNGRLNIRMPTDKETIFFNVLMYSSIRYSLRSQI